MRRYFLAMMLAALPLGAAVAGPQLVQEIDASEPGVGYGTVERLELGSTPSAEPIDRRREAVVRLDDGRRLTVQIGRLQHIAPGQRVRVVPGTNGARAVKA
jgi:hypothetical protein